MALTIPFSRSQSVTLVTGICAVAVAVGFFVYRPVGLRIPGFERLPDNPQGYAEYRHLSTGIVFVLIPGKESASRESTPSVDDDRS